MWLSILDTILVGSKLLRSNLSIQIKHLWDDVDIMFGEQAGFLLAVSFFSCLLKGENDSASGYKRPVSSESLFLLRRMRGASSMCLI